MLTKLKWGLRALALLFVAGFLHYSLPQHDIVRITGTYNRLTTIGAENSWAYASPDTGTADSRATRDIRFIEAAFADGDVMVYRNEDTGWIWPPYFKYDSSNLQAQAGNLESDSAAPKWVVVTHYGWRLPILSIYPNAVKLREASGPDERIIPWVSILVLVLLAGGAFMLRRMWLQFVERTIDPMRANAAEAMDGAEARIGGLWSRLSGPFRRKS